MAKRLGINGGDLKFLLFVGGGGKAEIW